MKLSDFALTDHEAAQKLGLCVQTVRNYASSGKLTPIKISPRCSLISKESVEIYLTNRQKPGRPAGKKATSIGDQLLNQQLH